MTKGKRVKAGTSKAAAVDRRSLFAKAFIANRGNATQAAITAGYSKKTAKQAGSRMLTYVDVKTAIEQSRQVASEAAALTVERTLREVARLAYFDPRKLYREDGTLKAIHELDDDTAAAIASVEVEELKEMADTEESLEGQPQGGALKRRRAKEVVGHVVKVKHWDKNAALEKAMKHLGQYELDNRQKPATTVNVGILTVKPDEDHFAKVRARALKAA